MQDLAGQSSTSSESMMQDEVEELPLNEVDALLEANRLTEAFFLARRMAAEGVDGAPSKVEQIRGML